VTPILLQPEAILAARRRAFEDRIRERLHRGLVAACMDSGQLASHAPREASRRQSEQIVDSAGLIRERHRQAKSLSRLMTLTCRRAYQMSHSTRFP
jgi:hypothetical protein